MRAGRWARLGALAAASAAALLAPCALGQASAPEATLAETVAALAAADVHARETAMEDLANSERFSFSDIENALRDPALSGEQRCRLMEAAKQRFQATPRAAMGVQFAQINNILPDRVVIGKTFEQFPAFKLLQPGDLIMEVEGVVLRRRSAQDLLGAHIISRDPGDKLHLVVRRGEQKLVLDVELGKFSDLPNTLVDPNRLALAWELRARSLRGQSGVTPIDCGVPADRWDIDGGRTPEEIRKLQRIKATMPQLNRAVTMVAGGQPRGGAVDMEELSLMPPNGKGTLLVNDPRIWQQPQAFDFRPPDPPAMSLEQEAARLEDVLQQTQDQLARRTGPGGRGQERMVVEADRQRYAEMIGLLEKQLAAVRAEIVEKAVAPEKSPPDKSATEKRTTGPLTK